MITAKSFYSDRENTQKLLFASSNAELGDSGHSASAEDDAHILCTTFFVCYHQRHRTAITGEMWEGEGEIAVENDVERRWMRRMRRYLDDLWTFFLPLIFKSNFKHW